MTLVCQLTACNYITALWENTPKRNSAMSVGLFQIPRPAREKGRFWRMPGPPELPDAARLAPRPGEPNRCGSPESPGLRVASSLQLSHLHNFPASEPGPETHLSSLNSAVYPEGHQKEKSIRPRPTDLGNVHPPPPRLSWGNPTTARGGNGLF